MALVDYFSNNELSQSEQLHFAQQLLSLIQAGLPLLNAIEIMIQSTPKSWQEWLEQVRLLLQQGNSLSQCLGVKTGKFSPEFTNLIRVSERSGNLSLALETISKQLESKIELRRKIIQSLTYPLITLASSVVLIIVMMLWVVPVFKEVFDNFQAELPAPTLILISSSQIIEKYFMKLLLIGTGIGIIFIVLWSKLISLQRYCDRLILRLPLFGNLFRLATLGNWCRTLGHLINAGLALPDALRVTAQSSNHWVSHDFSAELFKHLTRGYPINEALIKSDPHAILIDTETLLLLHIAAQGGSLAQMLNKRSKALDQQLTSKLQSLSSNLEPFLILFVGFVIGGLVIILYLPIFNLGQIV